MLRSDWRIIRVLCEETLQMCVPSKDLFYKFGLVDIKNMLKRNRLRMLGHVTRRRNHEAFRKIRHMEAAGWRPPGTPKNTKEMNVKDDLTENGAVEEDALDRTGWRFIINRLTS